jgi:glutamyl-tRNA synthetase
LSTFPLHSLIYRAFGWEEPIWVHLSVFLKPSGKGKMSKREATELKGSGYSIFIKDLTELGYLPEAVVNWIALMGWSLDDHTEFFTLNDLIDKFSLSRLNPSPAAINFTKFDHFNGVHIRNLQPDDLAKRLMSYFASAGYQVDESRMRKVAPIIQTHIATLDEAPEIAGFLFKDSVNPVPEDLIGKNLTALESANVARQAYEILSTLPELKQEIMEPPMRQLVEEMGLSAGQVFGILRIAITGQKVSPPLFESMEIIDKEIVLERIKSAIEILEKMG